MNCLVVHAHPCPESYTAAVRDRVLSGLGAARHRITLVDLYASGYDPFLAFPSPDAEAVTVADALVLVHPTWWTSQPAILLGWLGHAVATGMPAARTLVTVTTLGGSRLANRLGGESGARVVDRAVRLRCERRPVHRRLALYGLDRSTPARREAFLDRVEARIGELVT